MTRFLVVFDVDSTLIQDEVIELLADASGQRSQVEEITERAMRGEIDFAESLLARVRTLANLPESVIEATYQRLRPTTGVIETISAIHELGGKVGAVSGGFTQVLEPLAEAMNLDFYRGNCLSIANGTLTGDLVGEIIDRAGKARALSDWAGQLSLSSEQTVAVGDGANDLEMMQLAGLSVAFNAKEIVRSQADLVIDSGDLRDLLPALAHF